MAAALAAAAAFPQVTLGGEVFKVEVQSISPVVYETPEPITTEVNSAAFEGGIPLEVREGTFIVPGMSYRLEAPRFIDPPEGAVPVPRLHEAILSVAALRQVGERWSVLVRVEGGLAGDLHAIDAGVLRFGGLVVGTRHISESLALGLGGALTYAFGQMLPVPMVRLKWTPRQSLSLEALLPAYATFLWRPLDRGHFGLFGELVGNEYAIRLPEIRASEPCAGDALDRSACPDHLAYTDGNIGALAGARLTGGLWLEARAGASLYRRFEMLNEDDAPVSEGAQRLPPSAFVKLRLAWVY